MDSRVLRDITENNPRQTREIIHERMIIYSTEPFHVAWPKRKKIEKN